MQLYRFDESGKKQTFSFYPENRLVLAGSVNAQVLHRCASFAEMERYMEQAKIAPGSILLLPGNGDGQEDHFAQAQQHKAWVAGQLRSSTAYRCIHCQESILGEPSFTVEIDNAGEAPKAGFAHASCLRPVDRVLGVARSPFDEAYPYLRNFDFSTWIHAKGQRLFAQLRQMGIPRGTMLWNDDIHAASAGRFCIKANLENGDCIYVTQRGFVVRGSRSYIQALVQQHNSLQQQVSSDQDPLGFTSISHIYGRYSELSNNLEIGESFLRCMNFECAPFTSAVNELFNASEDYYAPLAYLASDGSAIVFDGAVFLITNPLELDKYLKNWEEKAGFPGDEPYQVVTIKSDSGFDQFMRDAVAESVQVIVDPWFGNRRDLVRGCIIESYGEHISGNA